MLGMRANHADQARHAVQVHRKDAAGPYTATKETQPPRNAVHEDVESAADVEHTWVKATVHHAYGI